MFDIKSKFEELKQYTKTKIGSESAKRDVEQEIINEFERLNQRHENDKQIVLKLSERLEKAEKALEDKNKQILETYGKNLLKEEDYTSDSPSEWY